MSFSIATHTSTRWVMGCYTLASLNIALLSMIQPWVGFGLLLLLIWSTWQEMQGQTGWFRSWIPKEHEVLQVEWTDHNHTIHFYMNTQNHWWVRTAAILSGLTCICWVTVFMGMTTVSFSILPLIGILGLFGHQKIDPPSNTQIPNVNGEITVLSPADTTWNGLLMFLKRHQSALSDAGTVIIHGPTSKIPVHLPSQFRNWKIEFASSAE